MKFRAIVASAALAGLMLSATGSHAATITGDFATWAAAAGTYSNTSSTGLALYTSPVTSFPLEDGTVVTLAGTADTVLQPTSGWGPWSGTYAGDIIDTTTNTETISFPSVLTAFSLELSPDLPIAPFSTDAETFTITLSDGTTTMLSGDYPSSTTQFAGFFGGPETSITISTANAPDFAFGNINDVPEPLSITVMLTGLGGLGWVRQRLRRRGQRTIS